MTRKLDRAEIAQIARFVEPAAVPLHPARTFELPPRLYALTIGAYMAFIGLMAAGFGTGELWIPLAICLIIITMGFGTPALWSTLKPENAEAALRWTEFCRRGIVTATGPTSAIDATVQVMILPMLILLWGVAMVIVAALV